MALQDKLERELRETLHRGLEAGVEDVVLFGLHIMCGAIALAREALCFRLRGLTRPRRISWDRAVPGEADEDRRR